MSTTKVKIASQIKTSNLLTYTLVQNNLESNFQLIIQALSTQDDELSTIKITNQKLSNRMTEIQKIIKQNADKNKDQETHRNILKDRLDNSLSKIDQLQKNYQLLLSDFNKYKQIEKAKFNKIIQNPQKGNQKVKQQTDKALDGLMRIVNAHQDQLKRTTEKIQKNQQNLQKNHQNLTKQLETLKKQMNIVQKNNMDSQRIYYQIDILKKTISSINIQQQLEKNNQSQQQQLQKIKQQINNLKQNLQQQKRLRIKLTQQIWKINDLMLKFQQDKLNQDSISPKIVSDIQKDLSDLKKKLSIYFKDFNNNNKSPQKYLMSDTKISQNANYTSPIKLTDQDIKQQLSNKMKQHKTQILKILRKADQQISQNDLDKHKILGLQDAIKGFQYMLNSKADTDSVKKLIAYIQNKINYIFQLVTGANQEDALAARKQWYCLSCDKKLQNYKGKIGSYLSNGMKPKAIENDVAGGGMSMRSKSKVDLPTVMRSKKFTKQKQ